MRIFLPLRHPAIRRVWGGQLLSAIGDEMNNVATVWLAAQVFATGAGYLLAVHAACAVAAIFALGGLVESRDSRRTLLLGDGLRAVAVGALPIAAGLGLPLSGFLVVSVMVLGAVHPLFDSVLRRCLPRLTPEPQLLSATNALLAMTTRFARVSGPGLVAVAGALIPTVHLFTVDAVSFVLSALAIAGVAGQHFYQPEGTPEEHARAGLAQTLQLIRAQPLVRHCIVSGGLVFAGWSLIFPLGIGLLLHEREPDNVSALGAAIMAYGVGNVVANLLLGSVVIAPQTLLFAGRMLAGIGFAISALAPQRAILLAGCVLAASGGPATDLGFVGILQERYPVKDFARVYRMQLAMNFSAKLVLFFGSPLLFSRFGISPVLACAATVMLLVSAVGYLRYGRSRGGSSTPQSGDAPEPR